MNNILIYGAGGFARELASMMQDYCDADYRIACFVDTDERAHGKIMLDIPILSSAEAHARFPEAEVVIGVGNPQAREQIAEGLTGAKFPVVLHRNAQVAKSVQPGEGTIICGNNVVSVGAHIGRHVIVNYNCTIGHDAVIGDFSALMGSVSVSGHVHVGKRVYLGTGAVIIHGTSDQPLIIGDDAVIGAGAVVTRNVEPRTTVVGVPAKPLFSSPDTISRK